MKQVLFTADQVKDMIKNGSRLILAGDEKVLKQLPIGSWIAGTIPYFMAEEGGAFSQDKIFVTEVPAYATGARISVYEENTIQNVYSEAPENGFSVIIISAGTNVHKLFALNAAGYKDFASRPLVGWISGVYLKDLGKSTPKIFDGRYAKAIENAAVVYHVSLPKEKTVEMGIVNIFKQGSGDSISFIQDGFEVQDAYINGKKSNFAEYLTAKKIDTRLPLVTNLYGTMINVSFQKINPSDRTVDFYAPVFKGMEYKIAAPVGDYVKEFTSVLPKQATGSIFFSCNCILNYLYSELEGKKTADVTGPITFGEVAYRLLNQTLAYVSIR